MEKIAAALGQTVPKIFYPEKEWVNFDSWKN
jgi:hypothetical protein